MLSQGPKSQSHVWEEAAGDFPSATQRVPAQREALVAARMPSLSLLALQHLEPFQVLYLEAWSLLRAIVSQVLILTSISVLLKEHRSEIVD